MWMWMWMEYDTRDRPHGDHFCLMNSDFFVENFQNILEKFGNTTARLWGGFVLNEDTYIKLFECLKF